MGWAFAWGTLISAELVFGASFRRSGFGWYIFQIRNDLQTDRVFGVIGLVVENLVCAAFERLTVRL
jgi:NitT/TauT family transport system permease protein